MKRIPRLAVLAALAVLTVACGDRPSAVPPQVQAQRIDAHRAACITREIHAEADEDEIIIEETILAANPDTPEGQLTMMTSSAVLAYAVAFNRHADLRASAYAYVDSAFNHSATPADSARYMARADAMVVRTPAEGTLEANVLVSFERKFNEMLANGDHPCNWDLPF